MINISIILIPLAILIIGLIAAITIFVIVKKNNERLDKIVEGKESGKHTNLPEVSSAVKGVGMGLIIVFLIINLIGTTNLSSMIENQNQMIMNQQNEIADISNTLYLMQLPYTDCSSIVENVDLEKKTLDYKVSIDLKDYGDDTKVVLKMISDADSKEAELERTNNNRFEGMVKLDLYNPYIYEASINVTTSGITKTYAIDDLNIEPCSSALSRYEIGFCITEELSGNGVTLKGDIYADYCESALDIIKETNLVIYVDGEQVKTIPVDKTNLDEGSILVTTLDEKFEGRNIKIAIENTLTNGYRFDSVIEYTYGENTGCEARYNNVLDASGNVIVTE